MTICASCHLASIATTDSSARCRQCTSSMLQNHWACRFQHHLWSGKVVSMHPDGSMHPDALMEGWGIMQSTSTQQAHVASCPLRSLSGAAPLARAVGATALRPACRAATPLSRCGPASACFSMLPSRPSSSICRAAATEEAPVKEETFEYQAEVWHMHISPPRSHPPKAGTIFPFNLPLSISGQSNGWLPFWVPLR